MLTDAQFVAWLKDSSAIRCVLIEVNVKTGGAETTRFLSNKGYVTSPTDTPANTKYSPFVAGGIKFTETLSMEGTASLSFGDIEIDNLSGDRDTWLDDVWANRAIKVFIGDVRWPRADFRLVFDGIVANIDTKNRGRINLKISDKLQRLNTPITDNKLGGTTENADRLIPLCFGECHNVEPLLVDPVINEFRVHDGPIEGIIEVRDNGVPVAFTPFLSTGKFRLAAQPSGQITASVQGASITEQLGTEKVVNGSNITTTTGWAPNGGGATLSAVDGAIRVTGTGTSAWPFAGQTLTNLTVGKTYRVTFKMRAVGAVPARVYLRPAGYDNTSGGDFGGTETVSTAFVERTLTFTAAVATMYIRATVNALSPATATGAEAEFKDITIKEVITPAGYINTTAKIVRYISTNYGGASKRFTSAEVDEDGFASFDAANPQPVGLYIHDRMNVIEVLNKLAASVGGRVLIDRSGKLTIIKLTLPQSVPGTTVTPTDIVKQSLAISQMPPVKAGVQIGYCKNWTVQNNIAAGVPVNHADMYRQEWMTITQSDSLTAEDYKTFTEPVMEETMLLSNADALAEAQRRLNMNSVQRKVFRYVGMPWLMLESLGASQTIRNNRFGLEAGKRGQIVSLATDWLDPHITVEVLI